MQIDLQSTTFGRQRLILPFRGRSVDRGSLCAGVPSAPPISELRKAQRDALRAQSSEHIAWLGLALCALAVLVLSFSL